MADDSYTITLAKPIEAHGETLTHLTLRRPTVAELRQHGQPYELKPQGASASIKADYGACAGLISTICAIPPSAVDKLDMGDFDEMAMRLVGFTQRAPAAGAGTTSAPEA